MAAESSAERLASKTALLVSYAVAVSALTLAFLKLLYSTRLGTWTAERIPEVVWRQMDAWFAGPYGESAQDGELAGLGLVSLLAAGLVVASAAWLVRRLKIAEP